MLGNFQRCLEVTLSWEGGVSNNPKDPGGLTNEGVTQITYDRYRSLKKLPYQAVTKISQSEVDDIYKSMYWDTIHGDILPLGIDMVMFDFAVNSGPAHANSIYNAIVNKSNEIAVVHMICSERLSFLHRLTTWSTFGKGWSNRIADVELEALKMMSNVVVLPPHPTPPDPFPPVPVLPPLPKGKTTMGFLMSFIFARLNEKTTVAGLVSTFFAAIHFAAPAVLQTDLTNAIIAVVGVIMALIPTS